VRVRRSIYIYRPTSQRIILELGVRMRSFSYLLLFWLGLRVMNRLAKPSHAKPARPQRRSMHCLVRSFGDGCAPPRPQLAEPIVARQNDVPADALPSCHESSRPAIARSLIATRSSRQPARRLSRPAPAPPIPDTAVWARARYVRKAEDYETSRKKASRQDAPQQHLHNAHLSPEERCQLFRQVSCLCLLTTRSLGRPYANPTESHEL
jgi:hypothetical protein